MDLYVDTGEKADRDQSQALAPRPRKRPSALILSSVPPIDQHETPSSTRSFSSESSQSKPSWARPLHLVRSAWILQLADRTDDMSSLVLQKQASYSIVLTYTKNLFHLM